MAAYAVQLGVPATAVRTETKAMSTWQNIELSLPMVDGFDRLAIVSDPLHAACGRRFVRAQRPDLAAHLVSAGEYRLLERPLAQGAHRGIRDLRRTTSPTTPGNPLPLSRVTQGDRMPESIVIDESSVMPVL